MGTTISVHTANGPGGSGDGEGGGGYNPDGTYGSCSDDRRADNYYGNALVMPCDVLDGDDDTRVKLDVDDIEDTNAPDEAVLKIREVDCLYNGASGKQLAFISDPYAAPDSGS